MKSVISIALAVILLSLCLFGCSNVPETPAETYTAQYTYINPLATTAVAANDSDGTTYVQTSNSIDFVLEDYYVYGNTVAKITNVTIDDYGIGNVNGFADVELIAIGRRSENLRIAYKAYNAAGELVRSSYILTLLKGTDCKEGDIVEGRRFDFPRDTVKVEFCSYVAED